MGGEGGPGGGGRPIARPPAADKATVRGDGNLDYVKSDLVRARNKGALHIISRDYRRRGLKNDTAEHVQEDTVCTR